MRIACAVSGTRGDVQPAVVLGVELMRRGHDVAFGVPPNLVGFAKAAGLDAHPLGYDTREHMNSDLVRVRARSGSPVIRARALGELWNFGWDQMVSEMTELVDGADTVVTGVVTEQIALPLAQANGQSFVALHHAPIRRNSSFSPIPGSTTGARTTLATWSAVDTALWAATARRENVLRHSLGLPRVWTPLPGRITAYGGTEIQAYDGVFCPSLPAEWGGVRPFAGFLELDSDLRSRIESGDATDSADTSDTDTAAWMAAGSPPIYFGFGSMPVADPAAVIAAITQACRRLGERALISAGWNDAPIGPPRDGVRRDDVLCDDDVRVVGAVDHEQVFPQCRAVVHHGGAGSTAAGIRAARPTLVCWVSSDQPFWGARLEALGAGASMALASVTADTLEPKLRTVLSPEVAVAADALSTSMRSPAESVDRAATLVEDARPAS